MVSMTIGKGKRPRDPNQLAKWIVDRSTDDTPEPSQGPPAPPSDLSAYMAAIGRKGGQIGGKRRMETMTPEKRSALARIAVQTRWAKKKLEEK